LFHHRSRPAFGAGGIDGDIETAEARDGAIDEGAELVVMPHVGQKKLGFGAERAQLGRNLPAGVLAAACNDEPGVVFRESYGGRAADAGQSACDEDNLCAHGIRASGKFSLDPRWARLKA
jgi:hypothetical protein